MRPRLNRCRCGAACNPGFGRCFDCRVRERASGCRRPHDRDRDHRPRCQHVRCEFPIVAGNEHARWCAIHEPSFFTRRPSLAEYATARRPPEW